MKVLISMLTCKQPCLLIRLLRTIIEQPQYFEYKVLIMVNGTETYFEEVKEVIVAAADKTMLQNILFARSDSNGKPGKGHNSVLDYFRNSDFDYWLPIDGDDMLYPTAMSRYDKCLSMEVDYMGLTVLDFVGRDCITGSQPVLVNGFLFSWMNNDENKWVVYQRDNPYNNLDTCRTPSRPLVMSKRLALAEPLIRYSETMNEKEDFVMHISVMHHAYTSKMRIFFTSDTFVYCYDKLNPTSISTRGQTREEFDENKREFLKDVIPYTAVNLETYDLLRLRYYKFVPLTYSYEDKVNFVKFVFLNGYYLEGCHYLSKKRYKDAYTAFVLLNENKITNKEFLVQFGKTMIGYGIELAKTA